MSVIVLAKTTLNAETITNVSSIALSNGTYTISYGTSSTKTFSSEEYYIQVLWS